MAAEALESSNGRQNFQRLTRLLIAGGTKVAKETFDSIHSPVTLDAVLADPVRKKILRASRMTRQQWNKVYPSPGRYGKSEGWDLSLTHKMLRSICGLSPPATGWDDLPPDSDLSREVDLRRLKYYRNYIYGHVDERMEIKDEEFQRLWKDIRKAIIRLAGHLSSAKKKEWEAAIDDFLTAPLTNDDMMNVEELKAWYRQDVQTREELVQLKGDMSKIKELVKEISPTKRRDLKTTSDTCSLLHHEEQLLEWFCEECREGACRTCVTLKHRNHSCVNVNDPADMQTITQELLETSEILKCKIVKHKEVIRKIQKNGALRNDNLGKVKYQLTSAVENWIGQLREQEQKIIKDIEITEHIYQEHDDNQVSELEKHIQHMETSRRYTEKLASDGSGLYKVTQKEQAMRCSNEYINMDLKIEPKTTSKCQLKLNPNLTQNIGTVSLWDFEAEGDGLKSATVGGSSSFTISTIAVRGTSRQTLYDPTMTLNVTIQSDYADVSSITHDNKDGTYTVSFTPIHPGDHQISVIIDGQIISQCTCIAKPKQCILTGDGLRDGTVGLKCQFNLTVRDSSDDKVYYPGTTVNVKIQSPQGNVIPAIHDNKDGVCNVSFVPTHPGDHTISATFDSHYIPSYVCVVKVKRCIIDRDGLAKGIVGLRSQFTVAFTGVRNDKLCYPANSLYVNIQSPHGTVTPIIKDNKDGTYHVSFFPVRTGDHRVSVAVQNNISEGNKEERLLKQEIPGSPFTVSVKAREFRPVLTFGKKGTENGEFDCPCGVAINTKDEIIVADTKNNRVQIFSCKGEHVRTIGSKGTDVGKLLGPRGVVCDKNNKIIVADGNNSRVQAFSETGQFLYSLGSKGRERGQFESSLRVSLDSDRNIIATDRGNNRVQVFSKEGEWLQSFDCDGPFHCVSHGDRYYVSIPSEHAQYVKVFDKSGRFMFGFGMHGSLPGEFNYPTGLALDKASHLVVCDSSNHRLQVLEMDGRFVASFGVRGEGLGQFCNPSSVAVMANGNLVVCDMSNHRIQLFE